VLLDPLSFRLMEMTVDAFMNEFFLSVFCSFFFSLFPFFFSSPRSIRSPFHRHAGRCRLPACLPAFFPSNAFFFLAFAPPPFLSRCHSVCLPHSSERTEGARGDGDFSSETSNRSLQSGNQPACLPGSLPAFSPHDSLPEDFRNGERRGREVMTGG